MGTYKVGYIIGSLAKGSINRKLATALKHLAPESLEMSEIAIRDLPLYSYDYDKDFPKVAVDFKARIEASDAVLIVTPEYNRSMPGGLKNALDWASRPYGSAVFENKPVAVIGTSPGKTGSAMGQQSLRPVLGALKVVQMNAVDAYVQFQSGLIDEHGHVTDERTEGYLRSYIQTFADFIDRHGKGG
jgi:chromate reductase